jgi:spore maturation protein CgeB
MHEFLAGMDINLAPLAPGYFNDCKSEQKIFNAALHGVVTVASPTRSYAETIKDGHDGLLARTVAEWEGALDKLIGDATLRRTLGRAAFDEIVPRFQSRTSGRLLAAAINEVLRKETM